MSPVPIDRRDPWLYHFTHVRNLPGIVMNGLYAHSGLPADVVECADQLIKARRRGMQVSTGPRGCVADYVPFYFAPRSPMLYKIWKGNVEGYDEGQQPLVYLVTRLSHIQQAGLAWVASNRNAAAGLSEFINDADALAGHIDWDVMTARQWNDTPNDPSRMQRRMAELLVHRAVPWSVFGWLATYHDEAAEQVKQLCHGHHQPAVNVVPDWYYLSATGHQRGRCEQ